MSTAAEIDLRMREGEAQMRPLFDLVQDVLAGIAKTASKRMRVKVISIAPRSYRGQRARRQAFYARQRDVRALEAVLRTVDDAIVADYDRAIQDMVVSGSGIFGAGGTQHDVVTNAFPFWTKQQ